MSRPAREPKLCCAERAELQRQGAKAAARGEHQDCNPLDQPLNQPPATGESNARWLQRSDAWRQGHEVQSRVRRHALPPTPAAGHDEHL